MATLFTQEMLRRGFLAGTSFYASLAHTPAIIAEYLDQVAEVFDVIAKCDAAGELGEMLTGPVRHSGFQRLN